MPTRIFCSWTSTLKQRLQRGLTLLSKSHRGRGYPRAIVLQDRFSATLKIGKLEASPALGACFASTDTQTPLSRVASRHACRPKTNPTRNGAEPLWIDLQTTAPNASFPSRCARGEPTAAVEDSASAMELDRTCFAGLSSAASLSPATTADPRTNPPLDRSAGLVTSCRVNARQLKANTAAMVAADR